MDQEILMTTRLECLKLAREVMYDAQGQKDGTAESIVECAETFWDFVAPDEVKITQSSK